MHTTFAPKGILQIDDAKIIYRNFSGAATKFNREGDRNFAVIIPDKETADAFVKEGWNVKIKTRGEDEDPFMFLPVKVKFSGNNPHVYLRTGSRRNRLDEESICCLDDIDIERVDLDIRPYDWEVNGKAGRTAYLQGAEIFQRLDRFTARFEEEME